MALGHLHNAHVLHYKGMLCRLAEFERRPLAQIVHYSEYMRELDPAWVPDHLRNSGMITKKQGS
jgi:hypothetical protein